MWYFCIICAWMNILGNHIDINPEYSLEELTLGLKLQYFGHLMRRADSLKIP